MIEERDALASRSRIKLALGLTAYSFAIAGFVALGLWQLRRRVWKLALIATVNARLHAPPVPAPEPSDWSGLTAANSAYRRVATQGTLLLDKSTLVQAVTKLGPGYWLLTPLRTKSGFFVLINRGYVPSNYRMKAGVERAQVTGLLRITEPRGGFLRANDPSHDRWYSRDVAAIARARGLAWIAPYFIDADGRPGDMDPPAGGLTVVSFPNSHLTYAITWFSLALLSAWGMVVVIRDAKRP